MIGAPVRYPLPVWWMWWGACFTGIFVVSFLLAPSSAPEQPEAGVSGSRWMVASGPFWISVLLRWLVLPRIRANDGQLAWIVFFLGNSLAELAGFAGLFFFPAHRLELFVLGLVGIIQWVPVFASRFVRAGELSR